MNLKFPVDKMWPKRSFIQRWAARIVAKMMLESKGESYQCSGEINWHLFPNRADVQVPDIQFAHWILRESGYSVCQADIEKRIGLSPDQKD